MKSRVPKLPNILSYYMTDLRNLYYLRETDKTAKLYKKQFDETIRSFKSKEHFLLTPNPTIKFTSSSEKPNLFIEIDRVLLIYNIANKKKEGSFKYMMHNNQEVYVCCYAYPGGISYPSLYL